MYVVTVITNNGRDILRTIGPFSTLGSASLFANQQFEKLNNLDESGKPIHYYEISTLVSP